MNCKFYDIHFIKQYFNINKRKAATIVILLMAIIITRAADYVPQPYTWTTQSRNSSESMPCGGHDVGMNVWVENGDLMFYISRSGMFDENNTLLKAGRWRLHISSNPFDDHKG